VGLSAYQGLAQPYTILGSPADSFPSFYFLGRFSHRVVFLITVKTIYHDRIQINKP
jgi:hypothetical protein